MTTADIAFTQPANPDRLRDYEQDARRVFWALLVAILIHLFVAFLLAAFSGFFSPALPTPEKPVELTLMDLSPTSPKNSAFIETDESKKAPEPKDKTFESNANSIGASELAAAGEMPLPSQAGKDRPLMDFESNPYSLDSKGAQAQQKPASQQNAAQPAAQPEPITAAEQFALLTQKSASALDAAAASSQAQSAYRRQKERTHIAGNITNRGISSVNALGTPLGRYQKIVADSIGSRWYTYVDQKRDLINIGTLRLGFIIDRSGRVKNLKVTENSSNEAFASVCVQSVMEAHLPRIPEDVAQSLPPEGFEVEGLGFIILEVIVGIAPLLGLIGAVSGLVHVFSHLGLSSGGSDTRQIALGIAEALNATVFGLSIAVPTLVGFTYFSRKVEVMSVEMETLVVELINKCYYGRAATREHKAAQIPTSVA